MRLPRVRFTVRWIMVVMAAVAGSVIIRDRSGPGRLVVPALFTSLLGALLALGVPRGKRRRFTASVVGGVVAGVVTGACLWFVDLYYSRRESYFTMGGPLEWLFSEAVIGGICGALVGLIMGLVASVEYRRHRLRFTVRQMMIALVLSASILFLLVRFLQAAGGDRAVVVVVAVVVGMPLLIVIDLLKKDSGSADDVGPDLSLEP